MGGLSVLVRLKGAFDAEVNAMVHPVRLDQTGTDVFSGFPAQTYSMNYSTVLWQIPAMAKYTFHSEIGGWHPFVESGLSFRIPLILSRFGAVEGAGMERHFGSFVVSPTVRYTRWQEAYPSAPLPSYAPGLKRDELDVLVGVRF
jgi:hypothetical protein